MRLEAVSFDPTTHNLFLHFKVHMEVVSFLPFLASLFPLFLIPLLREASSGQDTTRSLWLMLSPAFQDIKESLTNCHPRWDLTDVRSGLLLGTAGRWLTLEPTMGKSSACPRKNTATFSMNSRRHHFIGCSAWRGCKYGGNWSYTKRLCWLLLLREVFGDAQGTAAWPMDKIHCNSPSYLHFMYDTHKKKT